MATSKEFQENLKKGDLAAAFKTALSNIIELRITTSVIPAESVEVGSERSIDPRMQTRINIVDGDIETEIGNQFLKDGAYAELRDFHVQQVLEGKQTIRNNIDSLQTLLEIFVQTIGQQAAVGQQTEFTDSTIDEHSNSIPIDSPTSTQEIIETEGLDRILDPLSVSQQSRQSEEAFEQSSPSLPQSDASPENESTTLVASETFGTSEISAIAVGAITATEISSAPIVGHRSIEDLQEDLKGFEPPADVVIFDTEVISPQEASAQLTGNLPEDMSNEGLDIFPAQELQSLREEVIPEVDNPFPAQLTEETSHDPISDDLDLELAGNSDLGETAFKFAQDTFSASRPLEVNEVSNFSDQYLPLDLETIPPLEDDIELSIQDSDLQLETSPEVPILELNEDPLITDEEPPIELKEIPAFDPEDDIQQIDFEDFSSQGEDSPLDFGLSVEPNEPPDSAASFAVDSDLDVLEIPLDVPDPLSDLELETVRDTSLEQDISVGLPETSVSPNSLGSMETLSAKPGIDLHEDLHTQILFEESPSESINFELERIGFQDAVPPGEYSASLASEPSIESSDELLNTVEAEQDQLEEPLEIDLEQGFGEDLETDLPQSLEPDVALPDVALPDMEPLDDFDSDLWDETPAGTPLESTTLSSESIDEINLFDFGEARASTQPAGTISTFEQDSDEIDPLDDLFGDSSLEDLGGLSVPNSEIAESRQSKAVEQDPFGDLDADPFEDLDELEDDDPFANLTLEDEPSMSSQV